MTRMDSVLVAVFVIGLGVQIYPNVNAIVVGKFKTFSSFHFEISTYTLYCGFFQWKWWLRYVAMHKELCCKFFTFYCSILSRTVHLIECNLLQCGGGNCDMSSCKGFTCSCNGGKKRFNSMISFKCIILKRAWNLTYMSMWNRWM